MMGWCQPLELQRAGTEFGPLHSRLGELDGSGAYGVPARLESSTKQAVMGLGWTEPLAGSIVAGKKRASQSTSSKDAGRACK